jgi:integrase/recombinase XerD
VSSSVATLGAAFGKVSQMIEDFLGDLRSKGYASNTVLLSEKWLKHFRERCPKPLSELKKQDLTRYHQSLQWEPGKLGKLYSENTANQAVGVIKSYFRWCIEQGYLKQCPASHIVTRRVPPKERVHLTPSQARKLLALPDLNTPLGLRDRAALALIIEVQASPGALSRLNLVDFQADTGALLLKGRKRRIVSLEPGLQADLERYIRLGRTGCAQPDEEALFVSRFGRRMCLGGFQQLLCKYCERAEVPKPSFS